MIGWGGQQGPIISSPLQSSQLQNGIKNLIRAATDRLLDFLALSIGPRFFHRVAYLQLAPFNY